MPVPYGSIRAIRSREAVSGRADIVRFFLEGNRGRHSRIRDTLHLFGKAVKRFGDKAGRPLVKNQSDKIGTEFFQLLDLMAVFHAADFDKHGYGWIWGIRQFVFV